MVAQFFVVMSVTGSLSSVPAAIPPLEYNVQQSYAMYPVERSLIEQTNAQHTARTATAGNGSSTDAVGPSTRDLDDEPTFASTYHGLGGREYCHGPTKQSTSHAIVDEFLWTPGQYSQPFPPSDWCRSLCHARRDNLLVPAVPTLIVARQ